MSVCMCLCICVCVPTSVCVPSVHVNGTVRSNAYVVNQRNVAYAYLVVAVAELWLPTFKVRRDA